MSRRKEFPINFTRHYYDVYRLLQRADVRAFIGATLRAHKEKRFRSGDNPTIAENEAFILADPATRRLDNEPYATSAALYSQKPSFDDILKAMLTWADRL